MSAPRPVLAGIEEIYRERVGDFRRVARAVLGEPEAAWDAVQDGFVRAVRDHAAFREEVELAGWVWACVMNAIKDAARASGRRNRPLPTPDLGPTPVERVRVDEAVRASIQRLPERQRLALFLRYYVDLDYVSIAAALGVATRTVAPSLNAAHAALREALKEVSDD